VLALQQRLRLSSKFASLHVYCDASQWQCCTRSQNTSPTAPRRRTCRARACTARTWARFCSYHGHAVQEDAPQTCVHREDVGALLLDVARYTEEYKAAKDELKQVPAKQFDVTDATRAAAALHANVLAVRCLRAVHVLVRWLAVELRRVQCNTNCVLCAPALVSALYLYPVSQVC
jgi:hypothetical protein